MRKFSDLDDTEFVRPSEWSKYQILPLSLPTLYRMIGRGEFPAPIKIGPRVAVWKVGDIRKWMASKGADKSTQTTQPPKWTAQHQAKGA